MLFQGRIARPGDQPTARNQRVVQPLRHFPDRRPVEVDQDIAAEDQIQPHGPGHERRVNVQGEVQELELHQLAQRRIDVITVAVSNQIGAGRHRRSASQRPFAIHPLAGLAEGHGRDVRGQDMRLAGEPLLGADHGQRVRFFARCTTGTPDSDQPLEAAPPTKLGQDLAANIIELGRLAKEIGFGDRQLDDQFVQRSRVVFQAGARNRAGPSRRGRP